jgi:hypothetical protein
LGPRFCFGGGSEIFFFCFSFWVRDFVLFVCWYNRPPDGFELKSTATPQSRALQAEIEPATQRIALPTRPTIPYPCLQQHNSSLKTDRSKGTCNLRLHGCTAPAGHPSDSSVGPHEPGGCHLITVAEEPLEAGGRSGDYHYT